MGLGFLLYLWLDFLLGVDIFGTLKMAIDYSKKKMIKKFSQAIVPKFQLHWLCLTNIS